MPLHFERAEYQSRIAKTLQRLSEADLDGLLMFRQESMYYLTGYDTFGYVYFQCLYLGNDGSLTLLTRLPDLRQAQLTSTLTDIRIWADGVDARPAERLAEILRDAGCAGKRIGVEYEAYGLTGRNAKRLDAALDGLCTLVDASELVSRLRIIKSPAELAYVRKAGDLADLALDEAHRLAHPGADEAEILAAMQSAVIRGGGDDPANEFIIGSGEAARLVRYHSGRRRLDARDQLMIEFAGVFRHYHVCLMRTIPIGGVDPAQVAMHAAGVEALEACKAALTPGNTVGDVFQAHARSFDAAGYGHCRMHACGYSLGTTFAPNWMDWPMIYAGNPLVIEPGMVFFLHMILVDDASGLAMSPGQTIVTTDGAPEVLSHRSLDLVVGL